MRLKAALVVAVVAVSAASRVPANDSPVPPSPADLAVNDLLLPQLPSLEGTRSYGPSAAQAAARYAFEMRKACAAAFGKDTGCSGLRARTQTMEGDPIKMYFLGGRTPRVVIDSRSDMFGPRRISCYRAERAELVRRDGGAWTTSVDDNTPPAEVFLRVTGGGGREDLF